MRNGFWGHSKRAIFPTRLLVALFFCLCAAAAPTRAQGGQFTAVAEHAFGQKIVFELTAVTDLTIPQATLFFRQVGSVAAPHKTVVPLKPSSSDPNRLEGIFELDPHSDEVNIAPFAKVAYWWELHSEEGQTVNVPSQTILYDDNRFLWQQVAAPTVHVYWTTPGVEVGEAAIAVFESIWPDIQSILPASLAEPLPVYIYPSSSDLRTALNLTEQPFAQGHVDPALGVVLVTAVNSKTAQEELAQNLPHALTDVLLYQSAGSDVYNQMPFWFKEGLALYFAGDNEGQAAVLRTAVANQTTIPLAELCQPVVPEAQFELAQAQAASLLTFVQNRYGDRGLADLAAAFVSGQDCATAVATVGGQSLPKFEDSWLQSQRTQPAALQFLSENRLWLLLILAGFAIMGLLVWLPQKR